VILVGHVTGQNTCSNSLTDARKTDAWCLDAEHLDDIVMEDGLGGIVQPPDTEEEEVDDDLGEEGERRTKIEMVQCEESAEHGEG